MTEAKTVSTTRAFGIKCRIIAACLLAGIAMHQASAATQVVKNGITWTFDRDCTVGQFVNGDWWVIDGGSGVKVVSVSPAPSGSGASYLNGSMINPVGPSSQGYDGRIDG
jgi:hypothetical protein